jgi:GrpB-like predicted nucleotidyltransferase (UPF0157 family)
MIHLQEYDKNWPKIYHEEKNDILKTAGKWIEGIEHVGSTSVPGLIAKPTIDICIGVTSLSQAEQDILKPLQAVGYEYIKDLEIGIPERRYLQKLNEKGEHLFHIHVVVINDKLWNEYIRFRDYLIANPEEAQVYASLKLELKEKFSHDRKAYTEAKSDYIATILNKAQIWDENINSQSIDKVLKMHLS